MDKKKRVERYAVKGNRNIDCWGWTGLKSSKEGRARLGNTQAARVAYEAYIGPIPAGMHVLHGCDNVECTNPRHLFLGNNAVNIADKMSKGRHYKGETSPNAKLTAKQVLRIREFAWAGISNKALAEQFKVARCTISSIVSGLTWGHLPITNRR